MSKTIRYKLTEEQYRVVLDAADGLGVSADVLGRQALFYVLSLAQKLQDELEEQGWPIPTDAEKEGGS